MKYHLTLIFLCFVGLAVAQDDKDDLPETDNDAAKYLNDGIKNDAKNLIGLSTGTMISGYLDVEYERKINNKIGIQVGGLYRLFEGIDLWEYFLDQGISESQLADSNKLTGFGYSSAFKWYPTGRAITQQYFLGMNYKNRSESTDHLKYQRHDIYMSHGVKGIGKNNIGVEVTQGFGYRIFSYKYDNRPEKNYVEPGFLYLWTFKIGYFF
ncbi:MAG: hypothetical protein H6608_07985 [Flavobacteriales bacterium]|nr:hypothetical protein [Flavobacteriales bacterium]